jgi:hypothetical protein
MERMDGHCGNTLDESNDLPESHLPVALFKTTWVPRHMVNLMLWAHADGAHDPSSCNMSALVSTVSTPISDADVGVNSWAI